MTDLYRRSHVIAQGALTNSKRPECFVKGVYPTHLVRGLGPHVVDDRDKRYLDFICGLGTNHFGYCNPFISASVHRQLDRGITFSLGSDVEIKLAEELKTIAPFVDKWKFYKTGTEACMAALRIARGHTNRKQVLSKHYHGWADEFVSLSSPATGICNQEYVSELHEDGSFFDAELAAVIVEPINLDDTNENREWLQSLRKKCTENGTLLIFDEIITFGRVPKNLVSNYYHVEPDLTIFGKVLGGGMPICAVGGKAAIMEGDYFTSGTFCGETLSITAALSVLDLVRDKYKVDHIWDKAKNFQSEFNKLLPQLLSLKGYGTRCVLDGDPEAKALLMQEACRAGILIGPSWFVSHANVNYLDQVLDCFFDITTRIKNGSVKLMGDLPKSPFSSTFRR